MAHTAQFDATIDSLDQGLQKAKPNASTNINSWVTTLNETNDPALKNLATELRELERMLTTSDDDSDSLELRQKLDSVGQHTVAFADKASGNEAQKITQLGQTLIEAANEI